MTATVEAIAIGRAMQQVRGLTRPGEVENLRRRLHVVEDQRDALDNEAAYLRRCIARHERPAQ